MRTSVKSLLKPSLTLTAFAAAAAIILSIANYFLYVPPSEGLDRDKIDRLKTVCAAESFDELDISGLPEVRAIAAAYRAASGADVGMIILETKKVISWGEFYLLVALKEDGGINGVALDRATDSGGLRTLPLAEAELKKFNNTTAESFPSAADIENATGATFTANGLIDSVKAAADYYAANADALKAAPAKSGNGAVEYFDFELKTDPYEDAILSGAGNTFKIYADLKDAGKGFTPFVNNTEAAFTVKLNGAVIPSLSVLEQNRRYVVNGIPATAGNYTAEAAITSTTGGFVSTVTRRLEFTVYPYDVRIVNPLRAALHDAELSEYTSAAHSYGGGVYTVYTAAGAGRAVSFTGKIPADPEGHFGETNITVYVAFNPSTDKISGVGIYYGGGSTYRVTQGWLDGYFINKPADQLRSSQDYYDDYSPLTGATHTSNGIYNAVASVCVFYAANAALVNA